MPTYLKKSKKRKTKREKRRKVVKTKRIKRKNYKKKNSRKSIKRKSKMKGGAETPKKINHSHSHTVYMCENHFNKITEDGSTVCPFWDNILTQLIKRDINENSYNDQGRESVRETELCSCCAISDDMSEKDCAVFRNLIYCSNDPPCGDITNTDQLCGECTFCTSI